MKQKKIIRLEHPRQHHMVGDGFRVAQYIPGYGRDMTPDTSPFLMLDYNSPWQLPPQWDHRPGVGYHPHRGFETVTIVYSWEVEHQDTAWHGGTIGPDEVQWMTAGSGLLHNEFMTEKFSREGGVQHAVQLWVDLPREHKMTAPRYQALTKENIPEVKFDGGKVRVIAGELHFSVQSSRMKWSETEWNAAIQESEILDCFVPRNDGIRWAAKTFSPVELYDIVLEEDARIQITLPEWYNTMVLVVAGSAIVNEKSTQNGDMVYLSKEGEEVTLSSTEWSRILLMAGKPLEQPVVNYGPFVMTTPEEIEEAFRDFRAGKMGVIDE